MEMQDILTLLSGPQGWYAIVGGLLFLLLFLVYRRVGKLAITTSRELSELREALTQLAARLETEKPIVAVEDQPLSDDSGMEMPEPEADQAAGLSVGDSPEVGIETATSDDVVFTDTTVAPEPESEVFDEVSAESAEDVFAFDTSSSDEATAEVMEEEFPAEAEGEDHFAEESQALSETPEDSGDFSFGVGDSEVEPVDMSHDDAEGFAGPASDLDEDAVSQTEPESPEDAGAFLFDASESVAEAEQVVPEDPDDEIFGESQHEPEPQPEPEPETKPETEPETAGSFVFGAGKAESDSGEGEPLQAEAPSEDIDDVQPPSVGPSEASAEIPPQPVTMPADKPSPPVQQFASLEPLPGNPDKPDVGVARCRECGRKIAYPKRLSGKRMRCPACRTASVLP
jgi:hypothetical protein